MQVLIADELKTAASVWLVDGRTVSDEKLHTYLAWLNPAERERYSRFVRAERQRQFLIGRVLLRILLGKLLSIKPEQISLTERPGLVPLLNDIARPPGFSLSHSGPWIACAVSAHTALGLDIEMLDGSRDLLALAEQAFDEEELALLAAKEGRERVTEFYSVWSEKEARYKLASTLGRDTVPNYIRFPHADISIVLCSELPFIDASLHIFNDW